MQLVNPAGFPDEILPVVEHFITCECATLTQRGTPITQPLNPYWGEDRRTIDVTTGLTYPAKAERARRNPKVSMLFSNPAGSGLHSPPVVLVQGMAAVRDSDLQGNTDRYVRLALKKLPASYKGLPRFVLKRMDWYFTRIWIQVMPVRILWWANGDTDTPPQRWSAPPDLVYPVSDPMPEGKQPASWKEAPTEWRDSAAFAVQRLGLPVLTVVDADGFPVLYRARQVALNDDGFNLEMPAGMPSAVSGAACLTFHTHPDVFNRQQNMLFVGHMQENGAFTVERRVGDWSLVGSSLQALWTFMSNGRRLAPRLKAEAARRGQPVPEIRLP